MSNVSVEMAGSYFEKDDYYSSENGPGKAEFFGRAATELRVGKPFDHTVFENLLHGLNPGGTQQMVQLKPKLLSQKEIDKAKESFQNKTSKIGLNDEMTTYIKNSVINKAGKNQRHFSREESYGLYAEVGKYISLLSIGPDEKKGLKKASAQLIKSLSKSGHRAALDCTFSAPKSISIACLVGGNSELLNAHKQAVDESLKFIEDRLAGTRIGARDARQFAQTGNVIGAKFHHGTSREGDPQLHTHCVIMNITQRDKKNWRAMHTDPIYQHSKLAGVLYQNKLAEIVQKLGYEIDVKTNGTFEIKGYTEQQLATFSKRRKQVMENSARALFDDMKRNNVIGVGDDFEKMKPNLLSQVTQKMNRISVVTDRQIKSEIKSENLQMRWQKEAVESGIKHPERNTNKSLFGSKLDTDFAKFHLIERQSVIKKLDLVVQNISRNLGRATSRDIAKAGLQDLQLITSKKEFKLLASLDHANKEASILKIATRGKGQFSPLIRTNNRDPETTSSLTGDQRKALETTISSKDQLLIWNGVAGSGKTWALKGIREMAAESGYKVVALAPDASSASVLGKQLATSSSTVHSFLKNEKLSSKTLLIVDEAGKFSTNLMHDLLRRIEGTKTRLILSGDHRQLGAVEAGNPYKALLKNGATVINLNESKRQLDNKLKETVAAISTQNAQSIKWATEQLKEKITERKSLGARINSAVKAYEKMSPDERKSTLIIADTNHERSLLTTKLREKKKAFGELGIKEFELRTLVARDLTESQKRCAEYFTKGEILVSNITSQLLSPGKQYVVEGIEHDKIQVRDGTKRFLISPVKENLSVYQLNTIKIAEKEKLEWRRNHVGHENREEIIVKKVTTNSAILQKQSGESVKIDLKTPQFIDYGHVSTTYSSQGKTADRVIALTQANASRESFYVAVSRARYDVQIITDDRSKLVQRALKSSSKDNALDHLTIPKFSLEKGKEVSFELKP